MGETRFPVALTLSADGQRPREGGAGKGQEGLRPAASLGLLSSQGLFWTGALFLYSLHWFFSRRDDREVPILWQIKHHSKRRCVAVAGKALPGGFGQARLPSGQAGNPWGGARICPGRGKKWQDPGDVARIAFPGPVAPDRRRRSFLPTGRPLSFPSRLSPVGGAPSFATVPPSGKRGSRKRCGLPFSWSPRPKHHPCGQRRRSRKIRAAAPGCPG